MPVPTPAILPAITDLSRQIAAGRSITTKTLSRAMDTAHQSTAASGAWSWRDAYDVGEAAFLKTLPALLPTDVDDTAALDLLAAAAARLPTQTRRSEQQLCLQQFSTPAHYAYLATRAACLQPGDVVLEPSAGIGALAACAGLSDTRLVLNEIDPHRRVLLEAVTCAGAHAVDAEHIDDLLPRAIEPTVILMNPPFSSSVSRRADPNMAARHLIAALKRLADGGRLVAIMPLRFAPKDLVWWSAVTARAAIRMRLEVDGGVYRKHGTNVDTALVIIDKIPGDESPPLTGRIVKLADALPIIDAIPGRAEAIRRCVNSRQVHQQLPLKKKASRHAAHAAVPTSAEISSVTYRVLETPKRSDPVSDLYAKWEPQRLEFDQAHPHVTPLVESLAMAAVAPPTPGYRPSLAATLATSGALSTPQLETVVYAGDAHSRFLPGAWVTNDSGDRLLASQDGQTYRFGFFLGDGTGCGKGRQVAAIILDNMLAGRRRAIWLSKSETLMEDAIRDWTAVGGAPTDMRNLRRWKPDESIEMTSGILFVTYAMMRSSSQEGVTRLQQIIDWLGSNFDGVIAFDEAHAMSNAAGGTDTGRGKRKASLQGLAGLRLQNELPEARILYVSATGASSVESLAYATRLGLWDGPEAPFPNRETFTNAMVAGGVAALEVVARDLKGLGLYVARSLSFDGVEYDILNHELTPEQRRIYDAYAEAFQIIHHNLTTALEATNVLDRDGSTNNGAAKSAAFSRFESLKQRFFNHLITGMKMPTVIAAIRQDLDTGASAVIQLVSTGEAMLERRIASLAPEDLKDCSLELTPREYVLTYLLDAFPVTLHRVIETEDGDVTTEIVTDSDGHPVQSQEALDARERLIEHLASLASVPTALDQLIWAFGTDALAEVTGRSRRPVYRGEAELRRLTIERRSASANAAETAAFQSGEKRVLVFSDAGGTGRSYHADLDAENQQRRHHYLVEPGWRADVAIQGLGRSHRSNQASAPLFRVAASDVAGEKRFTSTIARRLDALGALTKGQRQTGGQGMFRAADNMESTYARQALRGFYRAIASGDATSIGLTLFEDLTAFKLIDGDGALRDDLPPMSRLLNRMLAVDLERQAAMFDELFGFIAARIEAARQAGTLDVGVETIQAESLKRLKRDVLRTCPRTSAETILSTIERSRRIKRVSAAEVLAWAREGKTLHNATSGAVALRVAAPPHLTEEGQLFPQHRLIRPRSKQTISDIDPEASGWQDIDMGAFSSRWDAEVAALPEITIDRIHLLTGMLLPVWKMLPIDNPRVYRLDLNDGTPLLGRLFDDEEAGLVRARLKPTEVIDAASLIAAVLNEGRRIALNDGATLARRTIAGEPRLEIEQVPAPLIDALKARGCFTEIIDWKLRVFVPLHEDHTQTLPMLDAALEVLPIRSD